MTGEKRKSINRFAEGLRNQLGIDNEVGDFDIAEIVTNLGGRIEYFSSPTDFEKVVKEEDSNFVIRINRDNADTRKRFSIAHELGHLFLHMKFSNEERWQAIECGQGYKRTPGLYSVTEEEANEFAAAFLMPKSAFIKIAQDNSDQEYYYPQKIADHFNVSEESARYRGRNLGLWI